MRIEHTHLDPVKTRRVKHTNKMSSIKRALNRVYEVHIVSDSASLFLGKDRRECLASRRGTLTINSAKTPPKKRFIIGKITP